MNYYGTEKHKEDMKKLDEQIFQKLGLISLREKKNWNQVMLSYTITTLMRRTASPVMRQLTERYADCLRVINRCSSGKIQTVIQG